jgi:hypothetical protein
MNRDHDELELELAMLRPHEPSQELRQRIADALMPAQPPRSRSWEVLLRAAVVAGGLLAASLVIMLGQGKVRESTPAVESIVSDAVLRPTFDQRAPSLWVYRQASLRSPAELDALFDQHARGNSDSASDHMRGFQFAPFNDELYPYSGEL